MKYGLFVIIGVLAFFSCRNATQQEAAAQTNTIQADTGNVAMVMTDSLCFLLTEGLTRKDSTVVQLAVTGDTVRGLMIYMPYEKDSRRGNLSGIKDGKQINAQWIYMQEGTIDSINVSFRLEEDVLKQQQSTLDRNTGKEYFPNNAEYDKYYDRIDCNTAQALITRTAP